MKHIFSLTLCLAGLAIVVNCQSDEKLVLDVYYSNSCPDSKRFITNQLPTLIDDFVTTNRMDINLVSFGKASYEFDNETGLYNFTCQFGDDECVGMAFQNCVINKYPNFVDYYKFISCTMSAGRRPSSLSASEQAKACADELSIDFAELEECALGTEGNELSYQAGNKTLSLDPPLNYVPYLVVNDEHSNCLQSVGEYSALVLACNEYKNEADRPRYCSRTYQYKCDNSAASLSHQLSLGVFSVLISLLALRV